MIERIQKNEERLDNALQSIKLLEEALSAFKKSKKNIDLVNKYYGSKNWFKDKEAYENNEITKIKAGILSEDAVWNMNEEIADLIIDMKEIVKSFNKIKVKE